MAVLGGWSDWVTLKLSSRLDDSVIWAGSQGSELLRTRRAASAAASGAVRTSGPGALARAMREGEASLRPARATPRTAPAPARSRCTTWRRSEVGPVCAVPRCPASLAARPHRSLPPSAMRNLRLLRAGGCRAAAATGTPLCFCLGAEPGAVLVGSQYGLVELRPGGDSVRATAAGQGSGACRRVGVGCGCKASASGSSPGTRLSPNAAPPSWRCLRRPGPSRCSPPPLAAVSRCCGSRCTVISVAEEAFCASKILYLPF